MCRHPGTGKCGWRAVSNVRFELNLKGLNELMKSAPMQAALDAAAQGIATRAGAGFEVEAAHPIRFVAIASVHAASDGAKRESRRNATLDKAVGG